ncbi:MAG: 2-keto-4-pentenoate hydratase [Hyphomicrobiaceae bacterium]
MSNDRLDAIAQRLGAARRQGARISLDDAPADYNEAFSIQDRITASLGEPTVGWKVNELLDGRVTFAPIFAGGVVPAHSTWNVLGHEPAGIELELAFRMGADVAGHASTAELLDSVASAHVVFELCQSRLERPETVARHVALADFISNHGIIVGSEVAGWRDKDLKGVPGRLFVDGNLHIAGKSNDPLRALAVLPRALAEHGKALRVGHIVITGSLIGMNWLAGRRTIRGEIDGCGSVEATVAAAG